MVALRGWSVFEFLSKSHSLVSLTLPSSVAVLGSSSRVSIIIVPASRCGVGVQPAFIKVGCSIYFVFVQDRSVRCSGVVSQLAVRAWLLMAVASKS